MLILAFPGWYVAHAYGSLLHRGEQPFSLRDHPNAAVVVFAVSYLLVFGVAGFLASNYARTYPCYACTGDHADTRGWVTASKASSESCIWCRYDGRLDRGDPGYRVRRGR